MNFFMVLTLISARGNYTHAGEADRALRTTSRNVRLGFLAATGTATFIAGRRRVKEAFVRFEVWVAAVMARSFRLGGDFAFGHEMRIKHAACQTCEALNSFSEICGKHWEFNGLHSEQKGSGGDSLERGSLIAERKVHRMHSAKFTRCTRMRSRGGVARFVQPVLLFTVADRVLAPTDPLAELVFAFVGLAEGVAQ
jgi:hypothetical protein